MDTDDIVDLEIADVAHGGVFVGRIGAAGERGRVVFVPDTMPGERVRVRLTDTRKAAFWRGEVVEMTEASPHRRPHVWAEADLSRPADERPGGADFGHIALAHQRELKLAVIRDALARIGRVDVDATIEPPLPHRNPDGGIVEETPDATGWRTRVSLHVDESGRIGPVGARSHRVVPVETLPLAVPAIERAAARLTGARPGRIDLVQPADGRVRIVPRPDRTPARGATLTGGRAQRRAGRAPSRERPPGRNDPAFEVVTERVGARDFRVDAGGFWQVHRLAASTLSALVAEQVRAVDADPDAWHLDLYGGVGMLAAAIGDALGPQARITTVESDPRATEHAGENLAAWVGARAETGRVGPWLTGLVARTSAAERERLRRGVVVLDPPRAGAGIEVARLVAELQPRAVVYVACDPVALARDLGAFRDAGYTAHTVRAVDLFPHSHHVEAVTTLTRSAG